MLQSPYMEMKNIKTTDPKIYQILQKELVRQKDTLELIPSENYASPAVLEALGSVLTNKYSEGYPGKRYYGGNQFIDLVEKEAVKRTKKLFDVEHVNVQPYSGSPANLAVYFALCQPGDSIMGMNLYHGGHLTHGWKVSITGAYFESVQYTVDKKTHLLNYNQILKLAKKTKPKIIWAGATAYPRVFEFEKFGEIAQKTSAYLCVDIAHIAGLVIAGQHPSPAPFAHIITTTTHKTLRGPRGAMIMVTKEGLRKDPNLAEKIDRAVFPGLQGGPHDHQTAAIAICLKEAETKGFKEYAKQVVKNAKVLAHGLLKFGFDLVSGGTDNHLILINLANKGLTGKEAETALDLAGITVNKNTVPFDPRPPLDPSGIRLGTPAITTRGMKEPEMKKIAQWINEVVENKNRRETLKRVRQEVKVLCQKFPLPY
jgi:glycine hydroxymethyltransferase